MRVAVVGLGAVGSAAARFLAAAGHDVTGFEALSIDHDRGSSYGSSRIIRRVYPDALYARLMNAAYPLWEDLARESKQELLVRCGGLFFGPEAHPEMIATERALEQVGVPCERLSAAAAMARWPAVRLMAGEYAIHEPESGLLRASRCVLANARLARAHGAVLRERSRITRLEPCATGIRIHADDEVLAFDRVVVTAGPWTGPLLSPLVALPLSVTRQPYAYFAVEGDASPFAADRFPVWIDMADYFYGFPDDGEIEGIKIALHRPGSIHDPDSPDRTVQEADTTVLREYLERRIPVASGRVTHAKICLYTMTPDEDFIVDRLPGEPRVLFIGGLSGHGFKFTVLLGKIAAGWAVDEDPGLDLKRFSLSRFAG